MKSNRLSLIVLLCATLFMTLFLAGCGKEDATKNGTTKTVTYEGQNYTVPANPQRIAVLSNSVLYLLDATGGTAIARVNTNDKLPEKLKDAMESKIDLILSGKFSDNEWGDILKSIY